MLNKFNKIILIAVLLFLIFSFNVHGQVKTAGVSGIGDSVNITTVPAFPGANEDISIKIESFSFDLNSSEIIWAVDGVIKDKDIGKKNFFLKTGKIGSVSLVKIIIKTKEGKNVEKSIVIRPVGVYLFWQASSYTPPFYRGKALYSYQSRITVIALPEIINAAGAKIHPSNLIYKWTKDGKVLGEVSGYGKNKFSFSKSILSEPPEIKVEVMSPDNTIKASGEITLEPIEPKVIIYENNPLYGIIYEKAVVNEFKLDGGEITLVATPYFFSEEETSGQKIKYDWSMNGRSINNKQDEKQTTFRNADGGMGSARISVDLQNDERELQSARTGVLLNFEEGKNKKTPSF